MQWDDIPLIKKEYNPLDCTIQTIIIWLQTMKATQKKLYKSTRRYLLKFNKSCAKQVYKMRVFLHRIQLSVIQARSILLKKYKNWMTKQITVTTFPQKSSTGEFLIRFCSCKSITIRLNSAVIHSRNIISKIIIMRAGIFYFEKLSS